MSKPLQQNPNPAIKEELGSLRAGEYLLHVIFKINMNLNFRFILKKLELLDIQKTKSKKSI